MFPLPLQTLSKWGKIWVNKGALLKQHNSDIKKTKHGEMEGICLLSFRGKPIDKTKMDHLEGENL